jgi:hypothetical protein
MRYPFPLMLLFRASILAALLFAALPDRDARADAGDPVAEALFRDGQQLAEQGKYALACPKFAESQRRDPAPGTLLHLGDCYEHNGQLASAWATYVEASNASRAAGRKAWADNAAARVKQLDPRLPRFTVTVAEPSAALEVKRDGVALSAVTFTTAIPIDPGEHVFEASALGRLPWKQRVVFAERQRTEISVPALQKEPPQSPIGPLNRPPPQEPPARGSVLRPIGYVALGLGGLSIATGSIVGGLALSNNSRAVDLCPSPGACTSREGVDASERSKTFATVSTITLLSGLALAATGAVLVWAFNAAGAVPNRSTASWRWNGNALQF